LCDTEIAAAEAVPRICAGCVASLLCWHRTTVPSRPSMITAVQNLASAKHAAERRGKL